MALSRANCALKENACTAGYFFSFTEEDDKRLPASFAHAHSKQYNKSISAFLRCTIA